MSQPTHPDPVVNCAKPSVKTVAGPKPKAEPSRMVWVEYDVPDGVVSTRLYDWPATRLGRDARSRLTHVSDAGIVGAGMVPCSMSVPSARSSLTVSGLLPLSRCT